MKTIRKYGVFAIVMLFLLVSCKKYDNFTTYFNTYYNANKLLKESEDEFEYQDEKKRITPRIIVPERKINFDDARKAGIPTFLNEFIISKAKRQPVLTKLDSINIKGSKILAYHPKSDYIEKTLYLMAKAFFYKEEWLPSQLKCSELIDKFPDGDLSPDAHLLLSINLLVQQKYLVGKTMLSRTVDIAWQKERYDILSEAFRLEAELALYQNDLDAAVKPYLQAVAQSDDGFYKARWQLDLACLLYRLGKFEQAEKEFAKVHKYSPDYLGEFEADLYRAGSLIRLEKYWEAEKILDELENDGKYEEWKAFVYAQRMHIPRLKKDYSEIDKREKASDSLWGVNPATTAFYYDLAMDHYENNNYFDARTAFSRARSVRTMIYPTADKMYYLMNTWDGARNKSNAELKKFISGEYINDSVRTELALNLFELGRIHTQLGNKDSALYYYTYATAVVPEKSDEKARYMYVYSDAIKTNDPRRADSLLDFIVQKYPRTPYGAEAMNKLGYTKAFLQDSVADLFNSGSELMKYGNYQYSIKQFEKIYNEFPKSQYAPRALYSIGWLYERKLNILDSARYYYGILIEKYPNSVYAQDVMLTVNYATLLKEGKPIPDSLRDRPRVVYTPKPIPQNVPDPHELKQQEKRKKKKDEEFKPEDLLKPKTLLKKATDLLTEPVEGLELPNLNNFINSKDSTNQQIDSIKVAPQPDIKSK